jgi:hypothetical protein
MNSKFSDSNYKMFIEIFSVQINYVIHSLSTLIFGLSYRLVYELIYLFNKMNKKEMLITLRCSVLGLVKCGA